MTCSKLFSLTELTNEIMQFFRNDYKTLHSCILVNRSWCRLAIPLLWEDPFSMTILKNYYFIEIYLHNLDEDGKRKLNGYGINDEMLPSNTLFNYPSFIKHLNAWKIVFSIEKWVASIRALATEKQPSIYSIQNASNFDQDLNLSIFMFWLLLKIFIENEVNLHTFEVAITDILDTLDNEYFNITFELILKNPNFICNIKNLKLHFSETITNVTPFLKFLCSNCNSISSLHFRFPRYNNDKNNILIENYLSEMISLQQNLKTISFKRNDIFNGISLSLKNSNISNTLKIIIFNKINFKNTIILNEVFEQLNVLESIHILNCHSLNSDFIKQIININKPFKLKSLYMNEILQIEILQLLLRKSGHYLENVGFVNSISELKQQSYELIKNYCTKIKFFELSGFYNQDINSAIDLIKNISQNLNYLSINFNWFYGDYYNNQLIEFSSIVLRNLGQILPFKLEYLSLTLMINNDNTNDLEIFLNNSKNKFIKKLLIKNKMREDDVILPYIKEYIMKERRVKYLAIEEVIFGKKNNLFFLKDEVKEFELYNIQVLNYDDLYIRIVDFIKEMY